MVALVSILVYTLSMQIAPISPIHRSLNPTQNYAVVRFSFFCKNRNIDLLSAHLLAVCETQGYHIEENMRKGIRQRFSILISNSKTIGESESDIFSSMHSLARKFTDRLSVSLEEIQEDAIVWYTNITVLTETL